RSADVAGGGGAIRYPHIDRIFIPAYQAFARTVTWPLANLHLVRVGSRGYHLGGRVVSPYDGRRTGGGGLKHGAIAERAGTAEHRKPEHRDHQLGGAAWFDVRFIVGMLVLVILIVPVRVLTVFVGVFVLLPISRVPHPRVIVMIAAIIVPVLGSVLLRR